MYFNATEIRSYKFYYNWIISFSDILYQLKENIIFYVEISDETIKYLITLIEQFNWIYWNWF